jgi:hypothetical protein
MFFLLFPDLILILIFYLAIGQQGQTMQSTL